MFGGDGDKASFAAQERRKFNPKAAVGNLI